MIRAGIIGLGKMGISHYAIVNAHAQASVTAVCDTSRLVLRALRKQTGVRTYTDHRRMFDEAGLDCVVIATPTTSHAAITRDALERGLHVFCEKPFTLKPEEGEELAGLAADRGVVNQVGYHNRFLGTFRETQRLIAAGVVGRVQHVTAECYGAAVTQESGTTWRSKPGQGGGCLHDYAAHVIDLLNFTVGPPEGVEGTVMRSIFSREVEDAVDATLLYPEGVTARLAANWSDPSYRKITTRLTVDGTGGKIAVDRQECAVFIDSAGGHAGYEPGWNSRYITDLQEPVDYYLRGEEYSAQIDHFIKAIASAEHGGINTFSSAAATDRVIDMVARDGRRNA